MSDLDRRATATPAPGMPSTTQRWHSLDVLKGLALWGMIAHHFQEWTAGEVHGRFVGFERFVVTDLAPPLFAVALGAAAVVVGDRIGTWAGLVRPVLRWLQILVIGLGIDVVVHDGTLRGNGVLPTLAILGLVITVTVAAGLRRPWVWWTVAAACAVIAVPATEMAGDEPLHLLVNGPFSLAVYGVYAASGAAVAAHGLGRSERALPLVRSAAGVLVVGLALAGLAEAQVAPGGAWPPARYPGHLDYTLWGVLASLVIWAAARSVLPATRALGVGAARAGQRTLLVFTAHFAGQVVLRRAHLTGQLDTWRWGLLTWAAVAVVCAATTIPRRDVPRTSPAIA